MQPGWLGTLAVPHRVREQPGELGGRSGRSAVGRVQASGAQPGAAAVSPSPWSGLLIVTSLQAEP